MMSALSLGSRPRAERKGGGQREGSKDKQRPRQLMSGAPTPLAARARHRDRRRPMQGHRTLPAETPAPAKTLADLLAAGELACSAAQVARWLNVSKPTVIAAARRGELPGRQVGRQWRFSTKALAKAWGLDQAD